MLKQRLTAAKVMLDTGMFRVNWPDRTIRTLAILRRWGPTPAAAYMASAISDPQREAVIDERGVLRFRDIDRRTNALARGLRAAGVGEQDGIAIMCRNHRGFIEATVAASKLGASALYLNTMFAAPQIADVLEREDPVAVVYDEEFAELVAAGARGRKRFLAWCETGRRARERRR